jgi:uncharacterized protein YprB with RNaseH-like and TPR domain
LPDWARERLKRPSEVFLHQELRRCGDPVGLEQLSPGHARRTLAFALESLHGARPLAAGLRPIAQSLARLAKDAALEGLDLARARFLDIETTGLHGGAGNYPFLVAIGRVAGTQFVLEQHFLSHPAGEPAMLSRVAGELASGELLVSFFGKSFDRHRLEDKMRLHGIAPPFAQRPHLDLYHPLRRLYGQSFPNCRLSTLEQRLLGLERHNDLSGAFAPAAWFDHQAGRPHLLEGVFEHNRLDVLSLLGLCAHVNPLETAAEGVTEDADATESALALARARAFAKLHREARERGPELFWLERLLHSGAALTAAERPALELARAKALLALGRPAEARAQLEHLLGPGEALRDSTALEVALLLLGPKLARERSEVERLAARVADHVQRYCHPGQAPRYVQMLNRVRRRWKLEASGQVSG